MDPGEASVDLKSMIHGIHSNNASFAGGNDFFDITYPRPINQCNACHLEGTYYPVDTVVDFRLATTTDSGDRTPASLEDPEDDENTTFNAATCGGCHLRLDNPATAEDESLGSLTTAAHMGQNGSEFLATQTIEGLLSPLSIETCTVCHGPGGAADVGVVHAGGGE